jgi:hypothetical protein
VASNQHNIDKNFVDAALKDIIVCTAYYLSTDSVKDTGESTSRQPRRLMAVPSN